MKRIISAFLLAVSLFSMVGCSNVNGKSSDANAEGGGVDWPSGPVTIYVNGKAGSNLDSKARLVAKYLESELDTTFAIENVTGNGGAVMLTQYLAQEPGSNSMCYNSIESFVVVPMFQQTTYSVDDYAVVRGVDVVQTGLFANASLGYTDFEGMKEYYGSDKTAVFSVSGANNIGYMLTKGLLNQLDIQSDFITDGGYSEALVNVAAGHADLCVAAPNLAASYVEEGSLVPICIFSEEASTYFADYGVETVPTARELGCDFVWDNVTVFTMRAGTDEAIIEKVGSALDKIYADQNFQSDMEKMGFVLLEDASQQAMDELFTIQQEDASRYFEMIS